MAKIQRLKSSLCKASDFSKPWYLKWAKKIGQQPTKHRKQWEYVYILQALYERGMLETGNRGLGFAVGTEPLPAVFASMGIEVLATDIDIEEGKAKGWVEGNQLCTGLESLNTLGLCNDEDFNRLVSYRAVDMNHIPNDITDYDFNWSSCSLEHLGSLEKGLQFMQAQLKTLKPGGWAIHTSEYNVTSNDKTLESEQLSVFRRKDYERAAELLRKQGHFVEELDFTEGESDDDKYVDLPPYTHLPHLRLKLGEFVSTSMGLIIRKGEL